MSPRRGGDAGKAGDRYELEVAVDALLSVLDGTAVHVDIESVDDPDSVEFHVLNSAGRVFHQAKRQRSEGHWTISELRVVLRAFFALLGSDPTARCTFSSGVSAEELRELAERGADARDLAQFERALDSEQQSGRFERVLRAFGTDDRQAGWDALRRIRVDIVDESRLRQINELRAEKLLDANAVAAVDSLVGIAFATKGPIDRQRLLEALAKRGHAVREVRSEEADLARDQTYSYAATVERARLSSYSLKRRETDQVVSRLRAGDVLLVGGPGSGKSTVVSQVVSLLETGGAPVVAVRLDRLMPVRTPRQLGEQLGLDGSPVVALARLADAAAQDAVLVIDQLDAVSLVTGRRAQFFECVAAMIEEAGAFDNVRVLVACRDFDLSQDHRINELATTARLERVALAAPRPAEVRAALEDAGVNPARLSDAQIETLTNPLHIAVFVHVHDMPAAFEFKDESALFDLLWVSASKACDDAHTWLTIARVLSTRMSDDNTLTIPRVVADQWVDAVDALVDEGIVVRDGDHLAFFHERFFDYVYARQFVAVGGDLRGLLQREGGQLLSRRAQVRQILAFQRTHDFSSYVKTLRMLLTSGWVRPHIQAAVLGQLSAVVLPTEEELVLVEGILDNPSSRVLDRAWLALRGRNWPLLLDGTGRLERWLRSTDPRRVDQTLFLLRGSGPVLKDRLGALLQPYVERGEGWLGRIRFALSWGELHADRSLFDLYLQLLDRGCLDADENRSRELWIDVASLPEHEPTWAAEFLARLYHRRFELDGELFASGGRADGPDDTFMTQVADGAPQELVDGLLELVLAEAEVHRRGHESPVTDSTWRHRYGSRRRPPEAILRGVEDALRALASRGHDMTQYVERLKASDLEIAQYLLYTAWSASPSAADEALAYLAEGPDRIYAAFGINEAWRTHELIKALAPHAGAATLVQLESFLLDLDADGMQFTLLSALPTDRIGVRAAERLTELRRAFDTDAPVSGADSVSGFVGPPISEDEARGLDDDGWREVIARFDHDRRDPATPLIGGATQLARLMQRLAEEDPERFLRVALTLPGDTHPTYFEHLLIAAAQRRRTASPNLVFALVRRCHELVGPSLGWAITSPIMRLADGPLPDDIIDLVAWYAVNDSDPAAHDSNDADLLATGINTARGAAAQTIGRILAYHPDLLERLVPTLERLVDDASPAVRACAGYGVLAAARLDAAWTITMLERLAVTHVSVLATGPFEQAVSVVADHDLGSVISLVQPMLDSSAINVRAAGARRAGLLALEYPDGAGLLSQLFGRDAVVRANLAGVCAHNLAHAGYQTRCSEILTQLFDDPDAEVREKAADCFRLLPSGTLGDHVGLVETFLRSAAFAKAADRILLACEVNPTPLAGLTVAVIETWMDRFDEIVEDRSHVGGDALTVSELAVRAYSHGDPEVQERALDVIDELIEKGAYGVDRALSAAEADR